MDEAYELLGLSPQANGSSVEAAYWRRAREIAGRRAFGLEDATELERVNRAYETIAGKLRTGRHLRPRDRPSWPRRIALAALAAIIGTAVAAGVGYHEEIRDGSERAATEAQRGWDEAVGWLQELDEDADAGEPQSGAP